MSHLLILEQLKGGEKYPYQIIQDITAKFGSTYKPSTGVIYPSLYRLQDKGYVTKHKRFYRITNLGLKVFDEQYNDFRTRIQDFYSEKQFLKRYHEVLNRLTRVIYQTDREYVSKNEKEIVARLDDIAERIEKLQKF